MKPSTKPVLAALLALLSGCATHGTDDLYLTNHDFFDLTCASETGPGKRVLHVEIDAHGQFEVSAVKDGVGVPVEARTYTNAVTWSEGGDRWSLDRFSGTLTSKTAHDTLVCSRSGGRRF